MKLYNVNDDAGEVNEYFPTKTEAIARAKSYDDPGMSVIEHEIGKLTKSVACALASGKKFSVSRRTVWTALTLAK